MKLQLPHRLNTAEIAANMLKKPSPASPPPVHDVNDDLNTNNISDNVKFTTNYFAQKVSN